MTEQKEEPISRKEAGRVVGGGDAGANTHYCGATRCGAQGCTCICATHCVCMGHTHV